MSESIDGRDIEGFIDSLRCDTVSSKQHPVRRYAFQYFFLLEKDTEQEHMQDIWKLVLLQNILKDN